MFKTILKKRNNKGFSLVELIVVILIMAIIAVALAPQVMKWVGTSRTSTDNNNKATLKSAISTAVADAQANNVTTLALGPIAINATNFGTSSSDTTKINYYIAQVLNGDYCGGGYSVTISDTGAVTIDGNLSGT